MDLNLWLSSLQCTGEERSLLDCPREPLGMSLVSGSNAGVECTNDSNYTSCKY